MVTKKKRVMWISDYPLLGTSFGTVTYEFLTRLPDFDFKVLSLRYEGVPLAIADNVEVHQYGVTSQIRYYLKKFHPDVTVIFHSFWFLDKFLREEGLTQAGRTILYIPTEGEEIPPNFVKHFFNFDQVITPSNFSRKVMKRSGIDAEVVPHGVDTSFFYPIPKSSLREFRFGYLGMNDIRKQIPRVIEAYSRIRSGLLVLGAGAEGPYDLLEVAKQYNVNPSFVEPKLFGLSLSREAVRDLLQTLDVYISPASESFGLPALEAQACGVPVVSSSHGAAKEVLGNGAIYCNVADFLHSTVGRVGLVSVPDLYRKMRFLMQVPEARERMAKTALENAKKWPWETAVEKLKKELEG